MRRDAGRAMIVAVAGRRIDADGVSPARFPASEVDRVAGEIESVLRDRATVGVVCSAACGADLITAEVAGALGIRLRIVLPFSAARFRETSVVDRGGDWGVIFDRVISRARASGDLVVMVESEDQAGYEAASREILDQAASLASASGDVRVLALAVWEGHSRGADDMTAEFVQDAVNRGWATRQILTLP